MNEVNVGKVAALTWVIKIFEKAAAMDWKMSRVRAEVEEMRESLIEKLEPATGELRSE